MSKSASVSSSRVEQAVLIVFADLTRFMVNSRSTPDATLAELLDGYYRHAEGLVSAAGGHVVKFMGDAFLGPFGTDARFDVIGNDVNVAATLPARTVSLSAEAFRCLENGRRKAVRKHTAPVGYIPVDDPRP